MEVEVYREEKFNILYELPKDINFIVCIGGRGGMKTYEVSKFAAFSATINKKRIVVLRDEKSIIRETILNEIWARYDTANETGELDQYFVKNEYELKEKATDKILIYTKGFRASDNQKKANLKGSSDIDIAIIEEGEDIRDKEKFYIFIDSLRKEGCVVIMILNTPDINHFIIKNYFNLEPTEHDGYFKIIPKNIPGFLCIETSYLDNKYLPQHIIDRYEAYGNPNHTLYDLHYYLTAIKGLASSGRKGQVFKKVKRISLVEYMKLPFREIFGQDFGTASPAGLVGLKFDKNNMYIREINYLPMSIKEIGKLYCKLNLSMADRIIVDHADPEWRKLRGFAARELSDEERLKFPGLIRGFNVIPCQKGSGSIRERISLMNSLNIFAVEESKNLWEEINNYVYDKDKNGNYIDDPIDEYNHLLDPVGYVCVDQRGKMKSFGI